MVSPKRCFICSISPVNSAERLELPGCGQHHRRDAIGFGTGIRREAQRRRRVAVEPPADRDAEDHQHPCDRGAHPPAASHAAATVARTVCERGRLLEVGHLDRGVLRLEIVDERLQIAERCRGRRRGDPRAVLLHGQLAVTERAVENLARVVAVGVLRPRSCCLPRRHERIVGVDPPSPQTRWRTRGGRDPGGEWSTPPCRQRRRTLVIVRLQRQVVDYALKRRSLLAEVYSGRTGVTEVCDANPYLLRAAKYHGKPSSVTCPICRKEQLTLVSWVFGDHLGAVSGSARTTEELVLLAARFDEFAVHVVEVCRTCSWNHLVKSYVLGAPRPPKARGTRTARSGARTASE